MVIGHVPLPYHYHWSTWSMVHGSGDPDGGHCVAAKPGVVVTSDSASLTFLQWVFKCLFSSVFWGIHGSGEKYMVVVTQMERIVLQLSRVLLSQVTSRTLKTPLSKWLAFQYTNTIIMMAVFIGPRKTWGPIFGSGCSNIIWDLTDVTLPVEDINERHSKEMWQSKWRQYSD